MLSAPTTLFLLIRRISNAVDVGLHFLLGAYRTRAFNKALSLIVGHLGKNAHCAHVARKRRGKPERNVG